MARKMRPSPPSLATLARLAAGYSIEQVATYCRTTPAAIRDLERAGQGWSYQRAERLARLYGCSIDAFPAGGAGRRLAR